MNLSVRIKPYRWVTRVRGGHAVVKARCIGRRQTTPQQVVVYAVVRLAFPAKTSLNSGGGHCSVISGSVPHRSGTWVRSGIERTSLAVAATTPVTQPQDKADVKHVLECKVLKKRPIFT